MRLVAGSAIVLITQSLLKSTPALSTMTVHPIIPGGGVSKGPFDDVGAALATPTLDLSIWDATMELAPVNLSEPLLFKLPDGPGHSSQCAFLELQGEGVVRWSTSGVRRASDEEVRSRGGDPAAGVWCATEHFSIFAAFLDALLGCTNLELLSAHGLQAVVKHEGWHGASSAVLVFCIAALLVLMMVLGAIWESRSMSLGRTDQALADVHICAHVAQLGPKLLKHKYAAILIYFKDMVQMLRSGHDKLKRPTILSGIQRFLAVKTGISTACVAQHCWSGGQWTDSKASVPNTVLCQKLNFHAGCAEAELRGGLDNFSCWHVLRRFNLTCMALHPLLDAMRLDAGSLTVMKRTTLQLAAIFGVLATNSLVFNFSGSLRSWEAASTCPIEPSSQLFVLVASSVSVAVSIFPNFLLMNVAKQVYGRPRWNALFWFLTASYMILTGLIVVVALANMNPKDQHVWYKGLQFAMSIKLIVIPLAQGLRHSLLLELFLYEDRRAEPSKQFATLVGLRHPSEVKISKEAENRAELIASQTISAEELLNFASVLGELVMEDYDPQTSTTEEVMSQAIWYFTSKPVSLEDYPLTVEVLKGSGLQQEGLLSCRVLHLGSQSNSQDARPLLSEKTSDSVQAAADGSVCWNFKAPIERLETEHAIGFVVEGVGDACLSLEQILKGKGWEGELQLQPQGEAGSSFAACGQQALSVLSHAEVSGSRGPSGSPRGPAVHAGIVVRASLSETHLQALAVHELRNLKKILPLDPSDVLESTNQLKLNITRALDNTQEADPADTIACGHFPAATQGSLSPSTVVVHSRQGKFCDLVAAILADALGLHDGYGEVKSMLIDRDFRGLLSMLETASGRDCRYWLEIFAMDPAGMKEEKSCWHKRLLDFLPTILRSLRRASCLSMIADIKAKRKPRGGMPRQLLVLDRSFHLLHEKSCLAEMMLAKGLQTKQHLLLHPEHLHDSGLGKALHQLAEELKVGFAAQECPWTDPFLTDRQSVYDTVRDLTISSVKEQRKDEEATWQELGMSDILATIGAVHLSRSLDGGPEAPAAADFGGTTTGTSGGGGADMTADAEADVDV